MGEGQWLIHVALATELPHQRVVVNVSEMANLEAHFPHIAAGSWWLTAKNY